MARDNDAKRELLLRAALEEFSAHGIAGARVDRLAKRAGVSAGSAYTYFDGKDGLFEAVYEAVVGLVAHATPLTTDDLAEYAARLYDGSLTNPEVLRFVSWYALERGDDDNVPAAVTASMREKVTAIEDAQRRGTVTDGMSAGQILALTLTIATMWQREGDGVRGLVPESERRQTIVTAVRRLTAPR